MSKTKIMHPRIDNETIEIKSKVRQSIEGNNFINLSEQQNLLFNFGLTNQAVLIYLHNIVNAFPLCVRL